MDKWHGGRELARFSKNSCEEVRLTLQNFGVGRYLDIRVWSKVRPTDETPSSPTEAGLVLNADLLPDLRRVIDQAIVALGGEVEGHEEARTQDSEIRVPGRHEDESGDPRPAGEKRRAQIDQAGRSPEREGQGQGQVRP